MSIGSQVVKEMFTKCQNIVKNIVEDVLSSTLLKTSPVLANTSLKTSLFYQPAPDCQLPDCTCRGVHNKPTFISSSSTSLAQGSPVQLLLKVRQLAAPRCHQLVICINFLTSVKHRYLIYGRNIAKKSTASARLLWTFGKLPIRYFG